MRAWRLGIVVVLAALIGAPTLLDRCLVNCHDQSGGASAVPPCHEAAAPSEGLSVRGVAACDHDHDAMVADGSADSRLVAARGAAAPLTEVAPRSRTVVPNAAPALAASAHADLHSSPPASRSLHLRL